MSSFSFTRWWGVVIKELQELKRDQLSAGMIIIIPIMQLLLFGYAINTDPKQLPTALINADTGPFSRSVIQAMKNSDYFDFIEQFDTEQQGQQALVRGEVQFVVSIPADFSHKLLRGETAPLLIQADATDPAATGNALNAAAELVQRVIQQDLPTSLRTPKTHQAQIDLRIHRMYNPEGITQYNIVPGLIGIILTMTLVLMTGFAITRERESGTMENLLVAPITPLEVMAGKMAPYIVIGLIQSTIIVLTAVYLFHVPIMGTLFSLYLVILLFIAASLTVGIVLSSFAQNQLQSLQLTFFYFLPSVLVTGFMFPFRGMPEWAQYIGSALPLTYFLRLIRGVMLKGNSIVEMWPDIWPLLLFITIVMTLGLIFYKRTLD